MRSMLPRTSSNRPVAALSSALSPSPATARQSNSSSRVGSVLRNRQLGFVIEDAVEHVGRIADRGGNGLAAVLTELVRGRFVWNHRLWEEHDATAHSGSAFPRQGNPGIQVAISGKRSVS